MGRERKFRAVAETNFNDLALAQVSLTGEAVVPELDDDNAALVPPQRPVESIADFRGRADECLRRAQHAKDAATRDYWLGLANTWTRLAAMPRSATPPRRASD